MVVPTFEEGDVVRGSTGLGVTLVDDVIGVATVVSFTGIGVGAEDTGGQHKDSYSSRFTAHQEDSVSYSVATSMRSAHVN